MIDRIRRSQLVFSSGPGAIVDLPDYSGIVMGLESWNLEIVLKMRRQSRSGFPVLFYPPTITKAIFGKDEKTPHGKVPVKRFPQWVQCSNPKCSTFGPYWKVSRRENQTECIKCDHKLVPARLIRICESGHIDDLPWDQFYHGDAECELGHPKYRLTASEQQSGSLDDLVLFCECNLHPRGRGLSEVYEFGLGLSCRGRRPWVPKEEEYSANCTKKNEIVMRGASNVYFPVVRSELTIPNSDSAIQRFVDDQFSVHMETIQAFRGDNESKKILIRGLVSEATAKSLGLKLEDLVEGILGLTIGSEGRRSKQKSEEDIRREELDVLDRPQLVRADVIPKVYSAREVDIDSHLQSIGIGRLVAVDRLQETRVLQGFRRVFPTSKEETLVDIGATVNGFYPAIEVNGEGMFISLDEEKLKKWEQQDIVRNRCESLVQFAVNRSTGRELPFQISPRSLLLHSFSHVVIKTMGLLGGYSSVAIRERIYSGPDYNGILLYTGETDSEGTMGGIVSLTEKRKFSLLIIEALEDAKWCSSDPLCKENNQDKSVCENLSACHACLFLAETSCEVSNKFLDRSLINGKDVGFFNE